MVPYTVPVVVVAKLVIVGMGSEMLIVKSLKQTSRCGEWFKSELERIRSRQK
jgi:hypothetical protein